MSYIWVTTHEWLESQVLPKFKAWMEGEKFGKKVRERFGWLPLYRYENGWYFVCERFLGGGGGRLKLGKRGVRWWGKTAWMFPIRWYVRFVFVPAVWRTCTCARASGATVLVALCFVFETKDSVRFFFWSQNRTLSACFLFFHFHSESMDSWFYRSTYEWKGVVWSHISSCGLVTNDQTNRRRMIKQNEMKRGTSILLVIGIEVSSQTPRWVPDRPNARIQHSNKTTPSGDHSTLKRKRKNTPVNTPTCGASDRDTCDPKTLTVIPISNPLKVPPCETRVLLACRWQLVVVDSVVRIVTWHAMTPRFPKSNLSPHFAVRLRILGWEPVFANATSRQQQQQQQQQQFNKQQVRQQRYRSDDLYFFVFHIEFYWVLFSQKAEAGVQTRSVI